MKSTEILKMLRRAAKILRKLQNLNPQKDFMAGSNKVFRNITPHKITEI